MGLFGSNPRFVADGEIYSEIRKIISSAEEVLVIVAPYVDVTDDFVREVEGACRKGVEVTLVFRHDKLTEYSATKWFSAFESAGVLLGTLERLHSKFYLNERGVILTSMNFTKSSGENSLETGVFFEEDHAIFDRVGEYFEKIEPYIKPASGTRVARARRPSRGQRGKQKTVSGFCIRCSATIPLDPSRPYCDTHYASWARYKDENYVDRHCHACGKPHPATMRKPVCRECYAKAA